ncbi:MAG: response regulator [Acidobacteria bacterium]|nr:response regulator [Acidobacteriota bacterium]
MAEAQQVPPRLLFVDDEESIRITMRRILEMHGFDVTIAGSVPEALAAIQSHEFEVLLADLNVGQPGDGFTIVSAMRRTQPRAATLILTGYPAFDTALEAIRRQVDAYVVKPADLEHLLGTIRGLLSARSPHLPIRAERVPRMIAQRRDEIARRWVSALRQHEAVPHAGPDDCPMLDWLISTLENNELIVETAVEHGRTRRAQKCTLAELIRECHLLRRELLQLVEENLLAIKISFVVADLAALNAAIDAMLAAAVEGYLEEPAKVSSPDQVAQLPGNERQPH